MSSQFKSIMFQFQNFTLPSHGSMNHDLYAHICKIWHLTKPSQPQTHPTHNQSVPAVAAITERFNINWVRTVTYKPTNGICITEYCSTVQLKCGGTRWRTAGEVKGGNWRMEWVASTLHTTSEHGVSIIITADAHTTATSSRLNWLPRRFKCTGPFRRKTKFGFWACAITFQKQSTYFRGGYRNTNFEQSVPLLVTIFWHSLQQHGAWIKCSASTIVGTAYSNTVPE